jgi:hypothetical protein
MTVSINYQITDLLTELYRVFNLFNVRFFENKLELPVIIVQSSRKRNTLGTCSVNKIWLRKATDATPDKYEITISAEHLNRPIEDICATLLHEMVHLHNGLNNIQDTSNRYMYHNKKFKEQAEKRGLIIEHAKSIGWSVTTLQPETREFIKGMNINEQVFEYYRIGAMIVPKIKVDVMTKEEKLNRLRQRVEKLKEKIQKLEAEA